MGDSGSPAFINRGRGLELFGLTSRGYPDNADDGCVNQSVYTNIIPYLSWISGAIDELQRM